jgi:hypothetical protein
MSSNVFHENSFYTKYRSRNEGEIDIGQGLTGMVCTRRIKPTKLYLIVNFGSPAPLSPHDDLVTYPTAPNLME